VHPPAVLDVVEVDVIWKFGLQDSELRASVARCLQNNYAK
jgi:hypothetical protein